MRWLKGNEEGAVAVMVAVMLVMLFGLGALVVDVGNLYWERRELQRGADAAAMAAAQELVATGSEADAYQEARFYANENNRRGAHVADTDFEITSDDVVRVTARTGSYEEPGPDLPSILAGVLGVDGYATNATAAVQIEGDISGAGTLPITICIENWEHYTDGGNDLPSGPPAHPVIFASAKGQQDPLNADCGNPGSSFAGTPPGGFGFLERDADCEAVTTSGNTFEGKPGSNLNDPKSDCGEAELFNKIKEIIDNDRTVLIPIFYDHTLSGNDAQFLVAGYAGYKLEGIRLGNSAGGEAWTYPASPPVGSSWSALCGPPSVACLVGYYENWVELGGNVETGGPTEDFGSRVIGFIQ